MIETKRCQVTEISVTSLPPGYGELYNCRKYVGKKVPTDSKFTENPLTLYLRKFSNSAFFLIDVITMQLVQLLNDGQMSE